MTISAALEQLDKAVGVLRDGGVIAMPTDTLYALTAAAEDPEAVRRVFAIKGREPGRPLPLFVSGIKMAEHIAVFDDAAWRLAVRFWPGQLTIVVPKRKDWDSEALSGSSTVGLRVPDHDVARAVVEALGGPVTGTSANLSGGPDPVSADEVRRQLDGRIDFILDAGPCEHGVASTVVDCSGPEPAVLRHGAVSAAAVKAALGGEEGSGACA
jgi:L-threonylcarbamoyladenylate synthase